MGVNQKLPGLKRTWISDTQLRIRENNVWLYRMVRLESNNMERGVKIKVVMLIDLTYDN